MVQPPLQRETALTTNHQASIAEGYAQACFSCSGPQTLHASKSQTGMPQMLGLLSFRRVLVKLFRHPIRQVWASANPYYCTGASSRSSSFVLEDQPLDSAHKTSEWSTPLSARHSSIAVQYGTFFKSRIHACITDSHNGYERTF